MSLYFPTLPVPSRVYATGIGYQTLISGFDDGMTEQRRNKGAQGKRTFNLQYNAKSRIDIDRLWNFYQLCRGSHKSFYFQSIDDTKLGPLLPYDQVTVWAPLWEGSGTKVDDLHGFLFPTYSCRFAEDLMSKEQFVRNALTTGLKLIQESVVSFTNNYGTLSGGYTWVQVPDGTVCPSFNGSTGYCSFGNAADFNVGTGDFSFAFAVFVDSMAGNIFLFSKKESAGAAYPGYKIYINGAGHIIAELADGSVTVTILTADGLITAQLWKIIMATFDRDGNATIYVNNSIVGTPTAISTASGNGDNTRNFYLGLVEGGGYGNFRARNLLFAKKVWTEAERNLIWSNWRNIFQI